MSLQPNLKRIEKGYIFDLDNILKDIALNFDIYTKESNKKIEYSFLYEKYINSLCNEKVFQCSAILANSNRCSHKSIKETQFLYCKKHIFKQKLNKVIINTKETDFITNHTMNDSMNESMNYSINHTINDSMNESINESMNVTKSNEINLETGMNQKIINDKLYYIDEKFIYKNNDNSMLTKCGYISDNEFIFIDDPYILEMIDH